MSTIFWKKIKNVNSSLLILSIIPNILYALIKKYEKRGYLASTINLIAVLSSPSITISVNAGIQTKFFH